MIYLDHAASSPIPNRVLNILTESLKEDFANPSSSHKLGKDLSLRIDECRKLLLKSVNGKNSFDLVFTSSATESNNMVIKGMALEKDDIVMLSPADHPSVMETALSLKEEGVKIEYFRLSDGGIIDISGLLKEGPRRVKLAILTFVNNQSGTTNDIASISEKIRSFFPDVFIHIDAVQGFGKFPVNIVDWDIDSMSVSSHKIGGPKGIAGLYLKIGSQVKPLMSGGGQESGLRSSTQAAPLIFGFSEAVKSVFENMDDDLAGMYNLNKTLRDLLTKMIPEIIFPFGENITTPYILTFILPGVPSDVIVRHLENEEIYLSTSSACSSGSKKINKSFSALLIPEKYHGNVLRASFSRETMESDLKLFSEKLKNIYYELSKII